MSESSHFTFPVTQSSLREGGTTVERHRHNEDQLIYVSRGVIAVTTDEGHWVVASNRAMWIPCGTWHEHRFHGASDFHTVGFPPRDKVIDASSPAVVTVTPLVRELVIAVAAAAPETVHANDSMDAEATHRLHAVLRDQLCRVAADPVSLPAPRDPRLALACREVMSDLSRPRSLRELATLSGAGERTLARLFRAELGMTYPQWRNTIRVYQAMIHLADGRSISATAHDCGWATPSAFIAAFRQSTGHTPRVYQRASIRG